MLFTELHRNINSKYRMSFVNNYLWFYKYYDIILRKLYDLCLNFKKMLCKELTRVMLHV